MKADEFGARSAPTKTRSQPKVAPQPVHEGRATAPAKPLAEARGHKTKRGAKSAQSSASLPPFGIDDPQGHVIRRIREAKPHLLAKIEKWD